MKYCILKYGILKSLLVIMILCCGFNMFATIAIDSTKTTISRCPNNGTITVFATSNQPTVLYSILSVRKSDLIKAVIYLPVYFLERM